METNERSLKDIESIIESLLFAAGDGLEVDRISEILAQDVKTLHNIIGHMAIQLEEEGRGIMIRQIGNRYQMCSSLKNAQFVQKMFEHRVTSGLSQAAYETLAVIAYKQPVTKAKVEQIRGVNSDSAFQRLAERGLIREAGRLDAPGRPILYETTDEFLKCFGFKSIADLPIVDFEGIYGM